MTTTAEQAYQHYHKYYNNETFHAAQVALVRDLAGAYQADEPKLLERALKIEPFVKILNLLTDTCLEISGHPDMAGRRERLMVELAHARVTRETVWKMFQHMQYFEDDDACPFSSAFKDAMLAIVQIKAVDLTYARALTGEMDTPAGRAAHALIASVEYLLRLTVDLLTGKPLQGYYDAQLRAAEQRIATAKQAMNDTA